MAKKMKNRIEIKTEKFWFANKYETTVFVNGVSAGISGVGQTAKESGQNARRKFKHLGNGRLRLRLIQYCIIRPWHEQDEDEENHGQQNN